MNVFLTYAAKGKTAWWRWAATLPLAVLLSGLLSTIVFIPLFLANLVPPNLQAELLQPQHPVVFFIGTGVMFGVVLLAFMAAVRLLHAKTPADLIGRWSWRLFFVGAGLWLAIQLVGSGIDYLIAPGSFAVSIGPGTGPLALASVLGLGVQTFTEEFLFRGYVTQGLLLATRRPWVAAVLSGLLFGALHYANGGPQAVNAVFFGVATAIIAIRTGGLAFTFGLHLINNIFGAVIVVSSADVFRGSPGLFTQTAPQLMKLDVLFGLIALVGVLWFTRKLRPPDVPDAGEVAQAFS
jgi:membrane protease YdiL (CAAX protease family)